jgi:hypothetical protein
MGLSDLVFILLLFIALVIIYYATYNSTITYYIEPTGIDPTFVEQARQILKESNINNRYKLKEVSSSNQADIDIILVARDKLHDSDDVDEFYPGTKKKIWFSYTWQKPKPHIAIDSINWLEGVPESGLSLNNYRKYVIQHEFMHALGYDHQPCNVATALNGICPVLYQATRGPPAGFKAGYQVTEFDYQKRLDDAALPE